jgi:hypothetical protein
MRGTFDFDTERYPFLAQHVGTNEICIRNVLTGEEFRRQPLAGEFGSPERKAQAEKLDGVALRLCRASREARSKQSSQPTT